jgi:hypothetical protein
MGFWKDLFGGKKEEKKEPEGSVGTVYQGAGGPGGMTGGEAFQSGIIDAKERREQLLADSAAANQAGQSYSLNTDEFTGDNLGLSNTETKGKLREGMTGPEYATFMQTLYGNNPGAMQQAFPFSSGAAVGNIMKPLVGLASGGSGIMGLIPNLLSSVNQGLGKIFNKEKAPTDMGTSMSSMDQADLDALSGPGMLDISGKSTSTGDGTFKTAEEAIAASGLPASEFAPLGITNPNLIQANSLLNFNDLLQMNENIDAQSIANAYKALTDNQGFDVQDNQLQYNQPLFGGNLQFGVGPDNAGIMFSKGLGA